MSVRDRLLLRLTLVVVIEDLIRRSFAPRIQARLLLLTHLYQRESFLLTRFL